MSQIDPTPALVESLLETGLDHYGRNEVAQAVRCWRDVLRLHPEHPQAMDYLESAGAPCLPSPHSEQREVAAVVDLDSVRRRLANGSANAGNATAKSCGSGITSEIEELVDRGQYEVALEQLYALRAKHPDEGSLATCIKLLRERLLVHYWDTLGHLDRVAERLAGNAGSSSQESLSVEDAKVLEQVDGVSSLMEIIDGCTLGRLATSRGLCSLMAQRRIQVVDARERLSVERERFEPPVNVLPEQTTPAAVPQQADGPGDEPAPSTARSGRSYEDLFRQAMAAYLGRRYDDAADLFRQCLQQRPDDSRVVHNLERLDKRR